MNNRQPESEGTSVVDPVTRGASDVPLPWESSGQREAADPFALLMPAGGSAARLADAPEAHEAPEANDVLERLKREAEAVLRDPDYVSAHAAHMSSGAASTWALPTEGDPSPLQTLAREAASDDSLMDMLDAAGHINALIGAPESRGDQQLFTIAQAPDVLRLFAGDIVPTRRRDVTAPLTRREHHLVSMDSAYRPAQAQTPEPEHDA